MPYGTFSTPIQWPARFAGKEAARSAVPMPDPGQPDVVRQQDIFGAFATALIGLDVDALAQAVTPDFRWSLPGDSPIAGTTIGAGAAIQRARLLFSFGLETELVSFEPVLNGIAVGLHDTGERGAVRLDTRGTDFGTFRGDQLETLTFLGSSKVQSDTDLFFSS